MPPPSASEPTDALTEAVHAALDARLDLRSPRPLVVALSGGGDSLALLALTAAWARPHGRHLVAVTVDHGLNPDSARWNALARDAATRLGADWRGVRWEGPKPSTGLPAAARAARHRLLATAAHDAGARVILLGHTRDDVAEGDWMRAEGSNLGRLRDWSPSPVWPEGRDLMLARPLLDIGRAELRAWLNERGLDWIDDPANADLRFARSRARAALTSLPVGEGLRLTEHSDAPSRPAALGRSSPFRLGEGALILPRDLDARTLAAAVVCAGGGETPPRGDRLAALSARLASKEDFTATLCGTRIQASGDRVTVVREPGERRRGGLVPVPLSPDHAVVWDGRFEIAASPIAGQIAPAAGHLAALDAPSRAAVAALPAAVRPGLPVLIRDDDPRPVLAGRLLRLRCLVASRFRLALGEAAHESELDVATVGEIAPNILFQQAEAKPSRRVQLRT